MNRTRDYYRKQRARAIHRKKDLSSSYLEGGYYQVDGKYSKNKIHCSCPLCKQGTPISTIRKLTATKHDLNLWNELRD